MIGRKKNHDIIPLRQNSLDRGVTAIMVFIVALAVLFMSGAVVLSDVIQGWGKGLQNSISVSALYPDDMQAETQQKITDKINQILSETQGVETADMVSDDQKQKLLSHWLGDKVDKNTIDLPALWDVTVANNFDVTALTTAIHNIYGNAIIDDYMHWKSNLLGFASDVVRVAYVMSFIAVCVLMILVSICVRALVALQMDTIQVLTLLGASDGFILRDVGRYAFWIGLKSAFLGVVLSAVVIIAVILAYTDVNFAMLIDVRNADTQQIFLANMLRIIGLCAIIPVVAILSRWGAIRSAKKCIRVQYRI